MKKAIQYGAKSPIFAASQMPAAAPSLLEKYLAELNANKKRWAEMDSKQILGMLIRLREKLMEYSDEWIKADIQNRSRLEGEWDTAISILAGPSVTLMNLDRYIHSFQALSQSRRPNNQKAFNTNIFDDVTVPVFPLHIKEKILFTGLSGELWFKPGLHKEQIEKAQAHFYLKGSHSGKISLVLGGGNYACLSVLDTLHKLLNDREVVILKMHPVTEYFGKILKEIFSEFIDEGFLRIVYGGLETGKYLDSHEWVNSIHITGSDKSFEAIVFGLGEELQKNKMKMAAKSKRVTGELGNVTPIIVVPGPWNKKDIDFQANQIISTMAFNSGFNCNASRVIIQQSEWQERPELLSSIEKIFNRIGNPVCYYPGSREHLKEIIHLYPQAKVIGNFENEKAPWVFLTGLDSTANESVFKSEVFGPFLSETTISAKSTIDFIEKSVEFCNKKLWGTLSAIILVHPKTLRDKKIQYAIDRAIKNLNYGMVCVNTFPGIAYLVGSLAWGGAPGATLNDIQSGNVFVHNPFMYEGIQKSVVKGPFRTIVKPLSPTHPKLLAISEKMLEFSKKPKWRNLFKAIFSAF